MTILFLDDQQVRHDAFREYATEFGFIVDSAYTADEAIRKLERNTYHAAALDHDLNDEAMGAYLSGEEPRDEWTGRAVARWIAKHGRPARVLLHSYNHRGAEAMDRILAEVASTVTRSPFGPAGCRAWLAWLSATIGDRP